MSFDSGQIGLKPSGERWVGVEAAMWGVTAEVGVYGMAVEMGLPTSIEWHILDRYP